MLKKFLVLEDSPTMRRVVSKAVQRYEKSEIFEAADGYEGIELLSKHKFDFFVVDWLMPNMDGLTFVKKIRSLESYKNTPILMITTKSSKADIVEAISAGIDDYIVKPLVPLTVEQKIINLFERKGTT